MERHDGLARLGREVMRTTHPHHSQTAPGQPQALHLLVDNLLLWPEDKGKT